MRRKDREITDKNRIEEFIATEQILRVAFYDDGEIYIVPVNYGSLMNESIYHHDYLNERLQLWVDNLNLLYVAFTRPKTNLIVWCKQEKAEGTVSELIAENISQTQCTAHEMTNGDICYEWGEVCLSEKEEKEI